MDPDFREPTDLMELLNRHLAIRRTTDRRFPESASRGYLFRIVDPVEHTLRPGAIDHMHEHCRRHPRTPDKKANKYRLFQLFDDAQFENRQIVYTYDFGDNWEHHLTILGRADPTPDFICLDGSGHYVAEDVGGGSGWENLKAAYRAQPRPRSRRSGGSGSRPLPATLTQEGWRGTACMRGIAKRSTGISRRTRCSNASLMELRFQLEMLRSGASSCQ